MVIDFHTHTFPKKIVAKTIDILSKKAHMLPSSDGSGEGLLASMKNSGVDYSVTFSVATKPEQVPTLNDVAIKELDVPGLIPFGSIHPDYEDFEKELNRVADAGIKGIKIHPVYQGTSVSDEKFLSIYKVCIERNLIVVTHGGLDVGIPGVDLCGPKALLEAIEAVPEVKMVAAHMGAWKQWDEAGNILAGTPLYYDTSFSFGNIAAIPGENHYTDEELLLLNRAHFVALVKEFGIDRVLYGTDSPWTSQSETIEFIRGLDMEETEIGMILGENAKKLLNL